MTRPGAVRPARPARWLADALLTREMARRGSPDHGDWLATRARPLSITAVTPSMVTELSATLVDRITLRRSAGCTARSCSAAGRSPCSGRTSRPAPSAIRSIARLARRISAAPGRNTSTSPSSPSPTSFSSAEATCRSSGSADAGVYAIEVSNRRPSDRSTAQPPRYAATGVDSMVADITIRRSSGRAVLCNRRRSASARSPSRWRSWNSSSTTTSTPPRERSERSLRVSTPSVMNVIRVPGPVASSKRTR